MRSARQEIAVNLWGDYDERYPSYTASIDAALALVERMLPGWFCTIAIKTLKYEVVGGPWADLASPKWVAGTELDGYAEAAGATPPLAILAALLSALSTLPNTQKEGT